MFYAQQLVKNQWYTEKKKRNNNTFDNKRS